MRRTALLELDHPHADRGAEPAPPTLLERLPMTTQRVRVWYPQLPLTRIRERDHRRSSAQQLPRQRTEFPTHRTPTSCTPARRHPARSRHTRTARQSAAATTRRQRQCTLERLPMATKAQGAPGPSQLVDVGHATASQRTVTLPPATTATGTEASRCGRPAGAPNANGWQAARRSRAATPIVRWGGPGPSRVAAGLRFAPCPRSAFGGPLTGPRRCSSPDATSAQFAHAPYLRHRNSFTSGW